MADTQRHGAIPRLHQNVDVGVPVPEAPYQLIPRVDQGASLVP